MPGTEFGVGPRLDPQKWTGDCVDPKSFMRPREEDPERDEFDQSFAEMLHGGAGTMAPPSPASRASPSTPRPMSTAFTDRSNRRREGIGSRAALLHSDASFSASAAAEGHGNCSCPVCKPFSMSPAGQVSHAFQGNMLHPAHQGTVANMPQATPRGAPGSVAGKRAAGSPNYDSVSVHKILKEGIGPDGAPCETSEESFKRQMGRKTKPTITSGEPGLRDAHARSQSTSPRHERFIKKFGIDLEASPEQRSRVLGKAEFGAIHRNEVAMILTPRDSDPPLPVRITPCKKGDGENKYKLSKHSEKISLHWNQPLYRYEMPPPGGPAPPGRSMSLPPERPARPFGGKWNPLTQEGCDEAGGSGQIMQLSGGGPRRFPKLHESTEMLQVTNHWLVAQNVAQERLERLEKDKKFADLCQLTDENKAREAAQIGALKERNNHKVSTNMASILTWEE